PERLPEDETAYLVMLCNLRCQPDGGAALIAGLLRPEHRPPALRDVDLAPLVAAPPACRERLRRLVDGQLAELRAAEEVLRTGPDAVARSRAVDPTLFLQDEVEARRFFRYWGESRATFLRCFKELEATRRRDADADFDEGNDGPETTTRTDP